MKQRILLSGESQIVKVGITSSGLQKIRIRVSDAEQVNTFLTDRFDSADGNKYFYIRMPKAPSVALVEVFNEQFGPSDSNVGFNMIKGGLWRMPLERKTAGIDVADTDVRTFI